MMLSTGRVLIPILLCLKRYGPRIMFLLHNGCGWYLNVLCGRQDVSQDFDLLVLKWKFSAPSLLRSAIYALRRSLTRHCYRSITQFLALTAAKYPPRYGRLLGRLSTGIGSDDPVRMQRNGTDPCLRLLSSTI